MFRTLYKHTLYFIIGSLSKLNSSNPALALVAYDSPLSNTVGDSIAASAERGTTAGLWKRREGVGGGRGTGGERGVRVEVKMKQARGRPRRGAEGCLRLDPLFEGAMVAPYNRKMWRKRRRSRRSAAKCQKCSALEAGKGRRRQLAVKSSFSREI